MKNYELSVDEVVLYKGNVIPLDTKGETQLILTNLNIVFITERKKFLAKDEIDVEVYPVDDIKIYKNIPQVKVENDNIVEIYLTRTEKELQFLNNDETKKFFREVKNLLIPKTKFEKCVEKVKDTIQIVDETLGIDSVDMVKSAVKDGRAKSMCKTIGNGVVAGVNWIKNKKRDKNKDVKNNDKLFEIAESLESIEIEMLENVEDEMSENEGEE